MKKIFNKKTIITKRKGSAFYFTILLLSIVMSISFGLNAIIMSQVLVTRGTGNSVIAFYAADTGIEEVLEDRASPTPTEKTLSNGATYIVTVNSSGEGNCNANNFCIISRGKYKDTIRAIQVTY